MSELDDAEPAFVISGVVGADLYSHFVSYGLDVWGPRAPTPFTGSETFNPYAEIADGSLGQFDTCVALGMRGGDVNDNADVGPGRQRNPGNQTVYVRI